MKVYCCLCSKPVEAELVTGAKIYPRITSLRRHNFWQCPDCSCYVGCHRKSKPNGLPVPLGVIPTPNMRKARQEVHAIIDPIWKSGKTGRKDVYERLGKLMGIKRYHTARTESMEELNEALDAAKKLRDIFDESKATG